MAAFNAQPDLKGHLSRNSAINEIERDNLEIDFGAHPVLSTSCKPEQKMMRQIGIPHCKACFALLPDRDWTMPGRPRKFCNDRCKERSRRQGMREKIEENYEMLPDGAYLRAKCRRCEQRFGYRFGGRIRVFCGRSC